MSQHRPHRPAGRLSPAASIGGGLLLLAITLVLGAAHGAYAISPARWLALGQDLLSGRGAQATEHLVLLHIRLPRLLLGALAGAGLGLAGALMQSLFRNPLADPGLIGVSSGAALAAALSLVLGQQLAPDLGLQLGS